MDVISRGASSPMSSSTLNPDAPMFVPMAYRTVEDFSDEWWALVKSSPWFRDYWLQERFHDPQPDPYFSDIDDYALAQDLASLLAVGDDDHYHYTTITKGEEEKRGCNKDLVAFRAFKWQRGRVIAPRFAEKAPKIVSVKVSPRTIQQPRLKGAVSRF
ncbi:hypothetical protein CFOL_v3_05975 [Cephalotus follicularis]|uniref:Uncharacterized protein n=1 Tax=Cephalotus follicularis TaxID=3775 RepID=A0A1Q3B3U4_CEPFO|nr:hypothetical protein CFOL_v3_05975 [Cephalotus follicularis]